jgi:hypothetical protein
LLGLSSKLEGTAFQAARSSVSMSAYAFTCVQTAVDRIRVNRNVSKKGNKKIITIIEMKMIYYSIEDRYHENKGREKKTCV